MRKISAVYKIVNTVTGDSYVGSSKDVKKRWGEHKRPSTWKKESNKPLYQDMQKYGLDKFRFQILAPVMEEHLKQVEQEFIELLHPTYNSINAKGWDVERRKEFERKYYQTDKCKETRRKYNQSEKGREANRKYNSQLCCYNGETLTLGTLASRFRYTGIAHPKLEAKKYLIGHTL